MPNLTVFVTDYTLAQDMDLETALLAQAGIDLVRAQCTTEEEVLAALVECDGMITQWAPVTRAVMERAGRCRAISRNGIGVDNIDLAAARELGIAVLNVPAYCVPEVADHALALILALLRKLKPTIHMIDRGEWGVGPLIPIRRLDTLTLGIIGLGRIGTAVARRAAPFFKQIVACDPYIMRECFDSVCAAPGGHDEVWQEADVITLHVPAQEGTIHLVNAESLARMKRGVYLVNTCRGAVVDTEALVEALRSGQVAGAALDVHEQEPLPPDHPLRAMENVILTPHVAYYSEESTLAARRQTCENLVKFFRGEEPISRLV
jgi:D-3-phosphoglycerate dehydrogenase